jgi:hypothetical protein
MLPINSLMVSSFSGVKMFWTLRILRHFRVSLITTFVQCSSLWRVVHFCRKPRFYDFTYSNGLHSFDTFTCSRASSVSRATTFIHWINYCSYFGCCHLFAFWFAILFSPLMPACPTGSMPPGFFLYNVDPTAYWLLRSPVTYVCLLYTTTGVEQDLTSFTFCYFPILLWRVELFGCCKFVLTSSFSSFECFLFKHATTGDPHVPSAVTKGIFCVCFELTYTYPRQCRGRSHHFEIPLFFIFASHSSIASRITILSVVIFISYWYYSPWYVIGRLSLWLDSCVLAHDVVVFDTRVSHYGH